MKLIFRILICTFLITACDNNNGPGDSGPTQDGESTFEISGSTQASLEYMKDDEGSTNCKVEDDGTVDIWAEEFDEFSNGEGVVKTRASGVRIIDRSFSNRKFKDDTYEVYVVLDEGNFSAQADDICDIEYDFSAEIVWARLDCPNLKRSEGSDTINLKGQFFCDKRLFNDIKEANE